MKYWFVIVLVAIGASSFWILGATHRSREISVQGEEPLPSRNATSRTKENTMIFVGDVMLSRSVGALMEQKGDYTFPFLNIATFLRNADLTFANLENPISSGGVKVGSIYSFRADPRVVEGLKFAGIDVVSIANNHMWDYGRQAFVDTLYNLTNAGIGYVGGGYSFAEAHEGITREINGTKVTLLAYTDLLSKQVAATHDAAGVSFLDVEQMKRDIALARNKSDIIVVSFHWGEEYQTAHNLKQGHIAKAAIDAGADLIVGHHPHVAQEVEEYQGRWIAYSLGNFIFDQSFSKATMQGLALVVTISDGKISEVVSQLILISNSYQAQLP